MQNVYIKAWKNLQSFDQNYTFKTWIYTITTNETYSFFRKWQKTLSEIPLENIEFQLHSKDDFSTEVNNLLNKQQIQKTLNQLPSKYQKVLNLYYFEELSYQEISDILKQPENTIATQIRRAKQKFKQLWQQDKPKQS